MTEAQITDRNDALNYLLGGNATFTLVSTKTNVRFTYKVEVSKSNPTLFFVSVLTGPDNAGDYEYIGTIWARENGDFGWKLSPKSRIAEVAPSITAIRWLIYKGLRSDHTFSLMEFWHLGKCSRCGRDLTDPVSIDRGLGPVCAEKVAGI